METPHKAKKRKRQAVVEEESSMAPGILLQMPQIPTNQVGPVVASFPFVQPPKSTPFKVYESAKKKYKTDDVTKDKPERIIAGESSTVEFTTSHDGFDDPSPGCSYLVAVHNKSTGRTVFVPAPLHILSRKVKALKSTAGKAMQDHPTEAQLYNIAQADLGTTFGTKKALARIRERDRNVIDVSAMEGVRDAITVDIENNTGGLLTVEQQKTQSEESRLIPPFDASAESPNEVYKLHDVIPELEWKSISFYADKKSKEDRIKALPAKWSTWCRHHLENPNLGKKELKMIYYFSAMLQFYSNSLNVVGDREKLEGKLRGVPSTVVDGLLSRFTESSRTGGKAQATSTGKTLLLNYMMVIALKVDNFASDPAPLAQDLSMESQKIMKHLKAVGCQARKIRQEDITRLGLPAGSNGQSRAVLSVPLQFPKPKSGKKNTKK